MAAGAWPPDSEVGKARAAIAAAEKTLRARLEGVTGPARGALLGEIWQLRRMAGAVPTCFSQFGQDWFVDQRLMQGAGGGVFVDVGGYDGVKGSNTLFFELMRGWSGLLVEPAPDSFARAAARRRCPCVQAAVAAAEGEAAFLHVAAGYTQMSGLLDNYDPGLLARLRADPRHRESVERVRTRTLAGLLAEAGIDRVDYLSLDVEGGERAILESFPFADIPVAVWSIENNTADPEIPRIMAAAGYRLVEHLGVDEIHVRPDLLRR